jgi:endonuclease/exonuclease/phosphatase (EEP) superfamily protein YafD
MRFIFVFTITLAVLVLAGCVSATAQHQVPESKRVAGEGENIGNCNVENIIHNIQDNEASDSPGLDPDSISVLNWNVYKGQRESWVSDFRRYSHKHDVVTMQEARLDDGLKSMLGKEHKYWALNAAFNHHNKATGVMTASRVKPVYSCGLRTAEPLIRLPKTSLISYYPVEGASEKLLVANIHGINFSIGVDVYKQQLEKLYSVISNHAGPVVLAGDFNTWSDERMQVVNDIAQRLSLESLYYENHNRTSFLGNVLDHVFYRGLEPLEQETWQVASSDHNPIRVDFRMNRDSAVKKP